MKRELAFVMVTPHTLAKSRTGGVIARYLARTDLNFVAARLFNPSSALIEEYAASIRNSDGVPEVNTLIADYILKSFPCNQQTGRPHRVLLLLFEGIDAVAKIWRVTGPARVRADCGETVRETYGEYVEDADGHVRYFEPAVLVAPTEARARKTLSIWMRYMTSDGGIVQSSTEYPEGQVQRTLVMLKPDNFRVPSLRTGSIIDVLSGAGLRIVGIKKFKMTVAQAEQFYGPVREALSRKFRDIGTDRAAAALSREFGFEVPSAACADLCDKLGDIFAKCQFEAIVEFMTGHRFSKVLEEDKPSTGHEECLALVYEGVDAVAKIREILGTTDPSKARPGSVRREFGSNIMVNAAHASDSPENALREMEIIRVDEENLTPWIKQYCT
jgi:nucleoside diphosphate kinase